ncbi:MAG: hypothetical protein WCA22_07530 [Candidatus Binatus sp.]
MRSYKQRVFWIIFPIATVLAVLWALFPQTAGWILQDYGLPAVGALVVLGAGWRTGRRPFGLMVLAILLTAASVLVTWHPITIIPFLADAMIGLGLLVAAVISLAAATVFGIQAFLRDGG